MAFRHSQEVQAPPQRLWELTLDIARWPQWTPTMTSLERLTPGPLALGSQVRIKQPGQPSAVWTVTALEAPGLFQWQTRLSWGPVLTGTHRIFPHPGGCLNQLELQVSGKLAWLLGLSGAPWIWLALWLENRGFRRAAEAA